METYEVEVLDEIDKMVELDKAGELNSIVELRELDNVREELLVLWYVVEIDSLELVWRGKLGKLGLD